jgi:hypothetical protein
MMKTILTVIALAFSLTTVYAEGEVKEVCRDKVDKAGNTIIDNKTGKNAQACKKIKVHKKLEGTKVPEKK